MYLSMQSKGRTWTFRTFLALLLVGLMTAVGCGNTSDKNEEEVGSETTDYRLGEPITDSTLAAIVTSKYGTDTLTTETFLAQYNMVLERFPMIQGSPEQTRELRRNLVEDFVMRHALFGEADELNIVADTERINMQIARIRSQFPNEEAYQQALVEEGITEDSLRNSIRDLIRQQMVQEHMEAGAVQPTESEIEAFRQEQAQQIRASHILFLTPPGDTGAEDSIRAKAEAVLDSIKAGADFAEMARRHSDDGSASQGGDLNYFSRGQMVPPFEEAAFSLKDSGDVTPELVKTQYGYHIIQLTDRRTGELVDTSQARQMLLSRNRQEAVEAGINRLRAEVTVRVNPNVVQVDLNQPLIPRY